MWSECWSILDMACAAFSMVVLFSFLWWLFFPPTIHGLVPGLMGLMPIFLLIVVPLLAIEGCLWVICSGETAAQVRERLKNMPEVQGLLLMFVNMVLSFPVLGGLAWVEPKLSRWWKRIELHSRRVGLDAPTLFRRKFNGRPCSWGLFWAKEGLRATILVLSCLLAMLIIGWESILSRPSLLYLWGLLSSTLVVGLMYLAVAVRTLLLRMAPIAAL